MQSLFRFFRGISNKVSPERLTPNRGVLPLASAKNVDIDDAMQIRRRRGRSVILSGKFHSLWGSGDLHFVVRDGDLCRLTSDDQAVVILPGVGDNPWCYWQVEDKVYASNGSISVVLTADSIRDWGVPVPSSTGVVSQSDGLMEPGTYIVMLTYVRDVDLQEGGNDTGEIITITGGGILVSGIPQKAGYSVNVYCTAPNGEELYYVGNTVESSYSISLRPQSMGITFNNFGLSAPLPGKAIAAYKGRMLVAVGNAVYATEPFRYELMNVAFSYKLFEEEVTMIAPVADGVYIGTKKRLIFMSGTFNEAKMTEVTLGEVYGRSLVYVSSNLLGEEAEAVSDVAVFMTASGIMVGKDGGVCSNLTESDIIFPAAIDAVSMLRKQDGLTQFVSVLSHPGAPASSAGFGEYVDVEIRRSNQ